MKNHFLKYTSILVIITFISLNLASAYPAGTEIIPASTSGQDLAVQLCSNPIADPLLKPAMRLKSYVAYMAFIKKAFLNTSGLAHSSDDIEIHFNNALEINIEGEKAGQDKRVVRFIPCKVEGQTLYLYHYRTPAGKDSFSVQTLSQFEDFSRDIARKGTISPDELVQLNELLRVEYMNDISAVAYTDKSVRMVNAFFDSIDAGVLKQKFNELIGSTPVLTVKGEASSYESIVVNSDDTPEKRAGSIMRQFLGLVLFYDVSGDIDILDTAFDVFTREGGLENFHHEKYPEQLLRRVKGLVFALNNRINGVTSNEDGINFHPSAYKTMVDLSDVTLEMCEKAGVIEDIRTAFNQVARHDLEDYNNGYSPSRAAHRSLYWPGQPVGEKINVEDMPGYGDKLIIRKLSNSLMPTALSLEDGRILVHENFVKVLYKLKEIGYKGEKAEVLGEIGEDEQTSKTSMGDRLPQLGNIYDAVVYSVAIHEIRGHFDIIDNSIVHNTDETRAQGERGRDMLKINLIGTLLLFLGIISDPFEGFDYMDEFIKQHENTLFRRMDYARDRKRLPGLFIRGIARINDWLGDIEGVWGFERVPIPDDPLPEIPELAGQASGKEAPPVEASWNDVVRVFDFLTLQRGEPISVAELVDLIYQKIPGKEAAPYNSVVQTALKSLFDLGLLRYNVSNEKYTLIPGIGPGNEDLVRAVRDHISGMEKMPGDKTLDYKALKKGITAVLKDRISLPAETIPAPDVFWEHASEVFRAVAGAKKLVTLTECLGLTGNDDTNVMSCTLDKLVEAGALLKYRLKGGQIRYAARSLARKQTYPMVLRVLSSVTSPPDSTDYKKLKARVFAAYSMSRQWINVLELVPLLVSMNEVYMVLVQEGLEDNRSYSPEEIKDFFSNMAERYIDTAAGGADRELVISLVAEKYGLDPRTALLLDHRLLAMEKYGRRPEPWTFNAVSVVRYMKQINESLEGESGGAERALSKLISKARIDVMDVDLFILKEVGILYEDTRPFTYSLAKFFNPASVRDRILKIGGPKLKVPVQTGHFQKIRDVLFANAPPTWSIASIVFESLQMEKDKTSTGETLLANVGSGVDKGSWNMVSSVMDYFYRMGIIDDFHVPGLSRRPVNSEEFYRTEFKAIDFSQEEMKRFHGFINSIGKVSEADFMSVFSEELVRISLIYSLREKGYIDSLNRLSSDFWQLGSYANLEFNHFIKNVVKISAAKRKEVYKILEEKYKGLTFSSDKDAIDYIKKEFIFQVLYPRLPGAFYFFKDIRDLLNRKKRKARDFGIENPEYPDYIDIATSKTMGNKSASMINSYLEFLIKVGLVEEIDERYYRPVRMYDTQMDRIESLFGDIHAKIDLEDAQMIEMFTTKILEVTEPLWAKRFLDDTKRVINKLEKAKSGSGDSRVLLAFDKTWIPAGQEKHVLDMLRALGKLSNIELVMSDDPFALASDIKTRKKDIPWENVITFVDRSFLETEADKPALFWEIYKLYDTGNKSHIIGIDNSNLSEDTYIRLLEMVSMAYEHAFDIWGSPLRHPHIEVVISKTKAHPVDLSDIRKYIIFIPDSEKINIDHIPAVYEAQIRVLTSA